MKGKDINILAIESSCDETSAAVVVNGNRLLSNPIASQIKSHMRFGGVVPEVASRHHVEIITQIIDTAMAEAGLTYQEIAAVAVTQGPGLVGSLLVGINAAKSLAFAHQKPLIAVDHIAGHIYANMLVKPLQFPLLALVVSGGHTELVYMPADNHFEMIGETRDDAVGEAYDKIGRVLGLPYPAGKAMDALAQQGQDRFMFPRAMLQEDNFDFSFSGLKTAVINTIHQARQTGTPLNQADLAASFQASVIDVLTCKTVHAIRTKNVKQFLLAGGVAANSGLRRAFMEIFRHELPDVDFVQPPLSLCGDNGAMIGAAAFPLYRARRFAGYDLNAVPGLALSPAQ